jgi:hypothetical protein
MERNVLESFDKLYSFMFPIPARNVQIRLRVAPCAASGVAVISVNG